MMVGVTAPPPSRIVPVPAARAGTVMVVTAPRHRQGPGQTKTGTVRFIQSRHKFDKKPGYNL